MPPTFEMAQRASADDEKGFPFPSVRDGQRNTTGRVSPFLLVRNDPARMTCNSRVIKRNKSRSGHTFMPTLCPSASCRGVAVGLLGEVAIGGGGKKGK